MTDTNKETVLLYVFLVQVLEELGILKNCKRYAGTSGGAIAAALLATGHSADEMRQLMALPMDELLLGNVLINKIKY